MRKSTSLGATGASARVSRRSPATPSPSVIQHSVVGKGDLLLQDAKDIERSIPAPNRVRSAPRREECGGLADRCFPIAVARELHERGEMALRARLVADRARRACRAEQT